jgi:hypothetical protein
MTTPVTDDLDNYSCPDNTDDNPYRTYVGLTSGFPEGDGAVAWLDAASLVPQPLS